MIGGNISKPPSLWFIFAQNNFQLNLVLKKDQVLKPLKKKNGHVQYLLYTTSVAYVDYVVRLRLAVTTETVVASPAVFLH